MIKEVIKRDGSKEPFKLDKILIAIEKAYKSCKEEIPNYLGTEVLAEFAAESDICNVERIHDGVEKVLMDHAPYRVARAYILYRAEHKQARFIRERIEYMEKYASSSDNAATSSETDANANVTIKNVANLEGEVYKTTNRIIQRQRMKDKLNEMYPELSKQYEEDLNHHIIYVHDEASTPVLKNYCMAVSMYPLLMNGTATMDNLKTSIPNNLNSFCGQFVNLAFLLSSQCKGAVGFGEFFNFFDYFCVKEWGENYHEKDSVIVDTDYVVKRKTIGEKIEQYFQQVVYSINQPAGNRSYQSPFINFNYFDSNYWHSLFDDFTFPDGSKPKWERVSYLQKKFMKWFNKERTKALLTFPVEAMCLLTNSKDVIDKEYKEFAAEMWAKGHSFFMYLSDNPDAIASCCRLRNELAENTFSSTTGLTGVQTGSVNVITLNLNRIIQDWFKSMNLPWIDYSKFRNNTHFYTYLKDIIDRVHKYHIAYKTMLYEMEEKGMLTSSKAGYISMKSLYSTIGINGLNEAAEFIGLNVSNNEDYKEFVSNLFRFIKLLNKEASTSKFRFNLEQVPAEGLGGKNYRWDKEDGLEPMSI